MRGKLVKRNHELIYCVESSDLTDKMKVSCRGRVVNVSDSRSSGPGFESRSDHYLDLFLGSPEFKSLATLVNNQLVFLRPVCIRSIVMFNLSNLFRLFAGLL